jgi:hypothetical protein
VTHVADFLDFVVEQLTDVETTWSIGTFGAIAEFNRDAGETAMFDRDAKAAWVTTARGGIRIEDQEGARLVASEALTAQSWNQRVAVCLSEDICAMTGCAVLNEIGPDRQALRHEHRDAVLFDLGLATLQLDACVRTSDTALIAELRRWAGRPLFAPDNEAIAAILAANPHRVFLSKLGRIEVFQPIPPPDGKSPDGPHTHILPKLLRHNRTHAATEALPEGWIPCAHFYPPHPARNGIGERAPFRRDQHATFQDLLGRFGDPRLVSLKKQVVESVEAGDAPCSVEIPAERFARAAVRVALRQLRAAERDSTALAAWLSTHDHVQPDEPNDSAGDHPCTG